MNVQYEKKAKVVYKLMMFPKLFSWLLMFFGIVGLAWQLIFSQKIPDENIVICSMAFALAGFVLYALSRTLQSYILVSIRHDKQNYH